MPNIFDGISKMEDEALRYQLASLEEITVSNVMSEMGQKAKRGTVKVFNTLRKIVNADVVSEPKVVSMEDRVNNKKINLEKLDNEALQKRMKEVLAEKVRSATMDSILGISDDELSVRVIEIAAKSFKKEIAENLTPAQKADAIYHRYNERLISQTREKYKKASAEEKAEIDLSLQKEVDAMSNEQKEELQKALGIKNITGEAIGKLIKTTAGATKLLAALKASGFGVYMALTTIIHAVFTTTLGITVPFAVYTTSTSFLSFLMGPGGFLLFAGIETFMLAKNKNKFIYELLAQVVWSSVMLCGGRFTAREESLPSWVPEEQRRVAIKESHELLELIKTNKKLKEDYENSTSKEKLCNEIIKNKENKINELYYKIQVAVQKEVQAKNETEDLKLDLERVKASFDKQNKIINYEIKKYEIINEELQAEYNKMEYEYKQALNKLEENKAIIESLNKSKSELYYEVIMLKEEIDKVSNEKNQFKKDSIEAQKKLADMQNKENIYADKRKKELEIRWKRAYNRFSFNTGVIKYVVKNYEYNELGDIDRALMELHEAKDPAAIRSNRGKMSNSNELHLEFSTHSSVPSRVFYKPVKNMSDGKTVIIKKICKHNYSRYGK